ncbi:DUF6223 family protein [Streptomyces sp. NPDC050803]|uniref:DUF6223 family protein n=1 Tax=unclassified Streptomyces TaxID=2593676 RepID=UPI00341C389D
MSVGSVLAAPAAAGVSGMTTDRLVATTAALVALAGVAVGWLVLSRFAGRLSHANRKKGAGVSLVAGLTGIVVGTLNLALADGGPGTGNGVIGGALAVILGVIATVLGRRALVRSRSTGRAADRPEYERAFE